jgi:hypothetical protein
MSKLARPIYGTIHNARIDRAALKGISNIAGEDVHMEVRDRVAVDLIVQLDGTSGGRNGRRDPTKIPHEGSAFGLRELVDLHGMATQWEPGVAWHRRVLTHHKASYFEFGDGIIGRDTVTDGTLVAADPTSPSFWIGPGTHEWPVEGGLALRGLKSS